MRGVLFDRRPGPFAMPSWKPRDLLRRLASERFIFPTLMLACIFVIALVMVVLWLTFEHPSVWRQVGTGRFWIGLLYAVLWLTLLIAAAGVKSERWLATGARKTIQATAGATLGAIGAMLIGFPARETLVCTAAGGLIGYFAEYVAYIVDGM